jgi:hypothetical protein
MKIRLSVYIRPFYFASKRLSGKNAIMTTLSESVSTRIARHTKQPAQTIKITEP